MTCLSLGIEVLLLDMLLVSLHAAGLNQNELDDSFYTIPTHPMS